MTMAWTNRLCVPTWILLIKYGFPFNRDVSGVELLMNNHQSLKAEIDTREDNFTACISLGKELLSRNHYASNEVKYFSKCFLIILFLWKNDG